MKYIFIVLSGVLLFSCSEPKKDVKFENPKNEYTVVYEYVEDVNAKYLEVWNQQTDIVIKKEQVTAGKKRMGFSYNKGEVCHIVLSNKPYKVRELEITVGHENLHCIYGAWHK